MLHAASDAVASGRPYAVLAVAGNDPTSLDQIVGETSFTVLKGATRSEVAGQGTVVDRGVKFHEKHDVGGKDVRVWHVNVSDDGSFTAACDSIY